jgi:hypothetical protein
MPKPLTTAKGRQLTVLKMLLSGKSPRFIAARMGTAISYPYKIAEAHGLTREYVTAAEFRALLEKRADRLVE